jgi:hypothetical protein
MGSILQRIWTAIVGGVAGAAVGLVVTIVLMQTGTALDAALKAVWAIAGVGVIGGLLFGGRGKNSFPTT